MFFLNITPQFIFELLPKTWLAISFPVLFIELLQMDLNGNTCITVYCANNKDRFGVILWFNPLTPKTKRRPKKEKKWCE